MSFGQKEREEIIAECYADPVLFCQTFLYDHFYRPIPWVHRGILSILTGKTKFLVKYGQISKIMRNFIHEYEDEKVPSRQIFHVFFDGREVSFEEVQEWELKHQEEFITQSTLAVPKSYPRRIEGPQVEIKLDLGVFTLLLMPRGSSKTTLAGFAVPLYKLLYEEDRFSLYVSKAERHTQDQLESIRKELATNEMIIEIFGDLKPRRSDEERWSKEKFETKTGIAMQARGKGSAIRGVHHNNRRPSTILVDDPQSKDDVRSDTIREEDKKWAFAELTPARARVVGSRGKIHVLGTWLHKECLVAVWSRDPRWTTVKMGVKDTDDEFIWPDYMDQKEYDEEKESFSRAGLLGDFYREYHNIEVIESELPFPRKFIIYEPPPPLDELVCATYLDPASSFRRTADYSAIVTVGAHSKTGMMWLLDSMVARITDEEKMEEYFRQSLIWKSVLHGVESNAGQAAYGTLIRQEMFRRGHYFELEMIHHKNRKVDRVRAALRPRYAAGYFRHRVQFTEHETQLVEFRYDDSHEHDDGPDAQAACVVLLDPTAAFNAEKDPGDDHYADADLPEDLQISEEFFWAS